MSRRFDKHTEILRTISKFCCRPFEQSRDLENRRRFNDDWRKLIDKGKKSPNRLRIGTPSFFQFQVVLERRFLSKHDVSTIKFLSRWRLHAFWSSVAIVYRIKLQTHEQRVHVILRLFDQMKTHVRNICKKKKSHAISTASFLWWLRHQLYSTGVRFDCCRAWSCSGFSSCFALDPTLSCAFLEFCWWVLLGQVYEAISCFYRTWHFIVIRLDVLWSWNLSRHWRSEVKDRSRCIGVFFASVNMYFVLLEFLEISGYDPVSFLRFSYLRVLIFQTVHLLRRQSVCKEHVLGLV